MSLGKCKAKPQWGITSYPLTCVESKSDHDLCWQGHREIRILGCFSGNVKLCSSFGNSMKVSQIIKQSYHMTQNCTSRYISKRNENICPHEELYTNVNSSIIHNSQKVETTQMSIDRWMNKPCVLSIEWNIHQP